MIKILGSAHNFLEIKEKTNQGCDYIVLSRIFETSNKNKKGHLGTLKFNLITRKFAKKFIALGGIKYSNLNKINISRASGYASISMIKKKAQK